MTTKFDELMANPEFRKAFAIEGAIADASQLICDLLESKNMKQADLARLLGKTPAYVSQLLSGKTNVTLKTLAEVAYELGCTLDIQACEEPSECGESSSEWHSEPGHAYRTRLAPAHHRTPYRLVQSGRTFPDSGFVDIAACQEDVA